MRYEHGLAADRRDKCEQDIESNPLPFRYQCLWGRNAVLQRYVITAVPFDHTATLTFPYYSLTSCIKYCP